MSQNQPNYQNNQDYQNDPPHSEGALSAAGYPIVTSAAPASVVSDAGSGLGPSTGQASRQRPSNRGRNRPRGQNVIRRRGRGLGDYSNHQPSAARRVHELSFSHSPGTGGPQRGSQTDRGSSRPRPQPQAVQSSPAQVPQGGSLAGPGGPAAPQSAYAGQYTGRQPGPRSGPTGTSQSNYFGQYGASPPSSSYQNQSMTGADQQPLPAASSSSYAPTGPQLPPISSWYQNPGPPAHPQPPAPMEPGRHYVAQSGAWNNQAPRGGGSDQQGSDQEYPQSR